MKDRDFDPDFEWLDHLDEVGLVVARPVVKDLLEPPERLTRADSETARLFIADDRDEPALGDRWGFFETVLDWPASRVAGAPGGPPLPAGCAAVIPALDLHLVPDWAVLPRDAEEKPLLLVRFEREGVHADERGAVEGWEGATPQQAFERLLRETEVPAGVLVTDTELRLVHAPKGETAGHLAWPLHDLVSVAGRPMLSGLKHMLGPRRLFVGPEHEHLPAILKASREAQATVSEKLAEQVLGALHELMRGLRAAPDAREIVDEIAARDPHRLYEGLLATMMRLVFILYAEDRDLIPSATDGPTRDLYDASYSVRGLFDKLTEDAARHPDTMDQRVGGWGRLLALFRLVHAGYPNFVLGRGGKLFDPDAFPFLEGRRTKDDPPRVLAVSDGCLHRILDGLMVLSGERLSYKALDVEQIGSVYETVMGFSVERMAGRALAIRAGKNNKVPVFVDLDALAAVKPANREKWLKETCDRANLPSRVKSAVKAADDAAALAAALDPIVDERGSPAKAPFPPGTPVLQPTDERRGTGSHYTPRTLTEPIVRQALEPAFLRLGEDATPEAVLDLKVCDPAMGSGAFLVEACRQLAERLVVAWGKHPDRRPKDLPPDEDEDLHARRLVAQRCLYGVDRNPMATDLARLSLWLATLARDHEFTFLDHALKSGDSLVGLTRKQIGALTWREPTGGDLFAALVRDRIREAIEGRREIREAPDDVSRQIQESRWRTVEERLTLARRIGDAVVSTFFAEGKDRARRQALAKLRERLEAREDDFRDRIAEAAGSLRAGDHPVTPFHWEIEFPEVFDRENPGFDAIVGNPPFAGKNTLARSNRAHYPDWLKEIHEGAHGNADVVAHFFRRAFALLREGGGFGLIASNTIAQGDTRETGLRRLIADGGTIYRATRRLKWPGDAAVVVSVVHAAKGAEAGARLPKLIDGRDATRISAFLVEGDNDDSPAPLAANAGKAFAGVEIGSPGFVVSEAADGIAPLELSELLEKAPRCSSRVKPYLGGEEVNNDPRHLHDRFVIDFEDMPLERDRTLPPWLQLRKEQRESCINSGTVPQDYPGPVASDWPELIELARPKILAQRSAHSSDKWWHFRRNCPEMHEAIRSLDSVFVTNRGAAPHLAVAQVPSSACLTKTLAIFAFSEFVFFSVLQSRLHEVWARTFASSMKDDLRYTPTDCFATFPFPAGFEDDPALEEAGRAYHDHRAELMIRRNEGLTRTYNRFHDPNERADDIAELRRLHAEMDRAVLEAYGWHDLAEAAAPRHLTEADEHEFAYQKRLFWPSDVRDEVLARLLDLNRTRAAAERGETPPEPRRHSTRSAARPADHPAAPDRQRATTTPDAPLFDHAIDEEGRS